MVGDEREVRAEGPGAIAIGGDAINSIFVTGGVNQFFVGGYERLADAYLDPRPLYRELHLDRYAGRRWLRDEIDRFVADTDRGYLVIEAETGMGKTAFVAWVARERGYVHHFVRLMPDADDVGIALRCLSAQLIRAWDLRAFAVGGVLPPNASRPNFFEEVLYAAALQRDATRPGEPIVLAVDGLNETNPAPGQNPLALPAELPVGVHIVVTQRTVAVPLVVDTPRKVVRIRADSPENLDDIREYLAVEVAEPDVARRVAEADLSPYVFVERLAVWSGGVWLVLRYVLAEVRRGVRRADDLASLPIGLWHYYARFWKGWQQEHGDSWDTVDLPLLVTLTAVQEPVGFDLLCELSGCADRGRAASLVDDAWRPFLQVQEDPDELEERFTAYHDSLGEFTAGHVDLSGLASAERSFVKRLVVAQRVAHRRIADRYLTAWGGIVGGLPDLQGDAAAMDGGYGLRQVVHHLVSASADEALHALMAVEWPRRDEDVALTTAPTETAGAEVSTADNAWYQAHRTRRAFASYALDVERAWARAEEAEVPAVPQASRSIALELRYALIATSVNSVAGNVPSDLLDLLVDDGLATVAQAVELAREITDPRTRAEALTVLLPRLADPVRDEVLRETLANVSAIPDGYWRAGELIRLAPLVSASHIDDVQRMAAVMHRPYYRDIVLAAYGVQHPDVAPVAALPRAEETSSIDPDDPAVFARQYIGRTSQGITALATRLRAELGPTADAHAQVVASRFVEDPRWRAELLTASAHQRPAGARTELLRAALTLSFTVGDRRALLTTLGAIAAALAERGELAGALAALAPIAEPEERARALLAVALAAPPANAAEAVQAALEAVDRVDDVVARRELLHEHAARLPELADHGRLEGEADTRAVDDLEQRDHMLVTRAVARAGAGDVTEATDAVGEILDDQWRLDARLGVALDLAVSGRPDDAAAVAADLALAPHRAEAMAAAGQLDAAYAAADAAPDPATRIVALLRIAAVTTADGSPPEAPPGREDALEAARVALVDAPAGAASAVDPSAWPLLVLAVAEGLARSGRSATALDLVAMLPAAVQPDALLALVDLVDDDAAARARDLAWGLDDPLGKARVLARLTGRLVAIGDPGVLAHVRTVLHLLAAGTRAQLLDALPDLGPGLIEIGGVQSLVDLAAAITVAHRWWP